MSGQIVVHLDGSAEDELRLAHAMALAERLEAQLTGLLVHQLPEVLAISDPSGSAFLRDLMARSEAEASAVVGRLAPRLDGPGRKFVRLDAYPDRASDTLAEAARLADLFVCTVPKLGKITPPLEESVLFNAGRGLLFVPTGSTPKFETILIGWKSRPEAARAVAEALPLLKRAATVRIAMVEDSGESLDATAGTDIKAYLETHGVAADVKIVRDAKTTGEALCATASEIGAGLLVMGGYGHSRMRELVLGGTTRDVLANATLPVLMAH